MALKQAQEAIDRYSYRIDFVLLKIPVMQSKEKEQGFVRKYIFGTEGEIK